MESQSLKINVFASTEEAISNDREVKTKQNKQNPPKPKLIHPQQTAFLLDYKVSIKSRLPDFRNMMDVTADLHWC